MNHNFSDDERKNMVTEEAMSICKKIMYAVGVILIVCGIVLLAIIKKGSGSIFPESAETAFIYILDYIALVGGIFSIYRGTKYEAEERRIRAIPVSEVRAKVLEIYRTVGGRIEVTFKTENGEFLRLLETERLYYFEGDSGTLTYKQKRILDFEVDS